jgi:hypothetical protein
LYGLAELNSFQGFLFFCQHNSTGGGFLILKQILEARTHFTNSKKSTKIATEQIKKAT